MNSSPPHNPIYESLLVALGGGLGTLTRHFINVSLPTASPLGVFPLSTLLENLLGAFLLGLLTGLLTRHPGHHHLLKAGLGIGFLGSFTTLSTFAADTFLLLLASHPGQALFYAFTSLLFGLLLAIAGLRLGQSFSNSPTKAQR